MNNTAFLAEVSSNHNRDFDRMKRFINVAADIGCAGVKFQLFKIDELFDSSVLATTPNLQKRKAWELPEKFLPELSKYSHEMGIKFGCTPFYLDAVDILKPYVDFYKIASYEILWHNLFKKCATVDKPIIFSTGMANLEEIASAIRCLADNGCKDVTVLHCNSAYPTPIKDANLRSIQTLRDELSIYERNMNIQIGWSDHTVSPGVIYRAVHKFRANIIEFHLDLDGQGEEYASGHCWLPEDIKIVINNINQGMDADGGGKLIPSDSELEERNWRADPGDGLRPVKNFRA